MSCGAIHQRDNNPNISKHTQQFEALSHPTKDFETRSVWSILAAEDSRFFEVDILTCSLRSFFAKMKTKF